MSKRVFVGIPGSKELKFRVNEWSDKKLKNIKVRIIPSKNLHITLVPPWNEENIDELAKKIEEVKEKFISFEIEFEKISFGPSKKRPRLIWLEGKPNNNFVLLKKGLEEKLNIRGDRKPFLPHITIARFRPRDFRQFPIKQLNEKVDWQEKVENFCLYESKTLPTGAVYKILKRVDAED
jgi:2'-5' RNA ligase